MKLRTSSSKMVGDASHMLVTLILTAVVFCFSAGAAVDWVSSPTDQGRPLNGSATFDCLVGGGGVGDRTVLWAKTDHHGRRQTLFIDEKPFDAPARYQSSRARDGAGYRLIINRIDTSDDADFACEIQQLGKASAHLTVLGVYLQCWQ